MAALVAFDHSGCWGETLVCEGRVRAALHAAGAIFSCAGDERVRRVRRGPPCRVLRARKAPRLFYLARPDGWWGLLCEPGDCARIPAGIACIDARDPLVAHELPACLPAQDDFVEQLLALMGEAPVD